jgi:tetratricopeptide (TPR) repeat protein
MVYYLDFEKSVAYYDKALVIANELSADEYKIQIYRGYTSIFATQQQYELALSYNEKAIEIARKSKDDQTISDLNAYGGNIYEETGDTASAMVMYEEVVRIESATNYQYSSKAALITVAHYYFLKGDTEKSLKQYRIAMKRFERLNDLRWVAYTHSEMSKVYLAAGILERAEQHGLAGLKIAEELDLLKEKSDNCYVLTQVYSELKNDSLANFYQTRYDSLMAEINPIELTEVAVPAEILDQGEPTNKKSQGTIGKLVQIAAMLGLIGMFILFTGMSKSSKK